MSDPFRRNVKNQLVREAQVGLVVVAVLLVLFVYVAYYRITGQGRQIPEHVRNAPIAWDTSQGKVPEQYANHLATASDRRFDSNTTPREWIQTNPARPAETVRPANTLHRPARLANPVTGRPPFESAATSLTKSTPRPDAQAVFGTQPKSHSTTNSSVHSLLDLQARKTDPVVPNKDPFAPQSAAALGRVDAADPNQPIARAFHAKIDESQSAQSTPPETIETTDTGTIELVSGLAVEPETSIAPSKFEPAPLRAEFANTQDVQQSESGFGFVQPDSWTGSNPASTLAPQPPQIERPSERSFGELEPLRSVTHSTSTSPDVELKNDAPTEVDIARDPSESNSGFTEKTEQMFTEESANRLGRPQDQWLTASPQTEGVPIAETSPHLIAPQPFPLSNGFQNAKRLPASDLNSLRGSSVAMNQSTTLQPQDLQVDSPDLLDAFIADPGDTSPELRVLPGTYVTSKGESFWSISTAIYQDGRYFSALYKANQATVPEFDGLGPGTTLRTPSLDELIQRWPDLCPQPDRENFDSTTTKDSSNGLKFKTPRPASARIFITRQDDTLFAIAQQKLGQASRYLEIKRMNEVRLDRDVDHLTPLPGGIRLVLPID